MTHDDWLRLMGLLMFAVAFLALSTSAMMVLAGAGNPYATAILVGIVLAAGYTVGEMEGLL